MADIIESALPDIEFVRTPASEAASVPSETPTGKRRGRPPGSGTKSVAAMDRLQAEIVQEIIGLAVNVGTVSPLTAVVLDERADKTAKALVIIAGKSPRFLKGLESAVKAGAIVDLAVLPIMVGTAFMVDMERIAPDSFIARRTGMDKKHQELYPESWGSGVSETIVANGNGHRSGLYSE